MTWIPVTQALPEPGKDIVFMTMASGLALKARIV